MASSKGTSSITIKGMTSVSPAGGFSCGGEARERTGERNSRARSESGGDTFSLSGKTVISANGGTLPFAVARTASLRIRRARSLGFLPLNQADMLG